LKGDRHFEHEVPDFTASSSTKKTKSGKRASPSRAAVKLSTFVESFPSLHSKDEVSSLSVQKLSSEFAATSVSAFCDTYAWRYHSAPFGSLPIPDFTYLLDAIPKKWKTSLGEFKLPQMFTLNEPLIDHPLMEAVRQCGVPVPRFRSFQKFLLVARRVDYFPMTVIPSSVWEKFCRTTKGSRKPSLSNFDKRRDEFVAWCHANPKLANTSKFYDTYLRPTEFTALSILPEEELRQLWEKFYSPLNGFSVNYAGGISALKRFCYLVSREISSFTTTERRKLAKLFWSNENPESVKPQTLALLEETLFEAGEYYAPLKHSFFSRLPSIHRPRYLAALVKYCSNPDHAPTFVWNKYRIRAADLETLLSACGVERLPYARVPFHIREKYTPESALKAHMGFSPVTALTDLWKKFRSMITAIKNSDFVRGASRLFAWFYVSIIKVLGKGSELAVEMSKFFASSIFPASVASTVSTYLDEKLAFFTKVSSPEPTEEGEAESSFAPPPVDPDDPSTFVDGGTAHNSIFHVTDAFFNMGKALFGSEYDEKIILQAGNLARAFSSVLTLTAKAFAFIVTFFTVVLPWCYQRITGHSFWTDDQHELLIEFDDLVLSLRHARADQLRTPDFLAKREKIFDVMEKIDTTTAPGKLRHREFSELCVTLAQKLDAPASENSRVQPVCVLLSGKPGSGKTNAASFFTSALNSLSGVPYSSVYFPVATSEYHDSYHHQNICQIDDFLQNKESNGRMNEALDVFYMVSPAPFPLNNAMCNMKGATNFTCKYLFLTSNCNADQICEQVSFAEAMRRRLHVVLSPVDTGDNAANPDSRMWTIDCPELKDHSVGTVLTFDEAVALIAKLQQKFATYHADRGQPSQQFRDKYPSVPQPDMLDTVHGFSHAKSTYVKNLEPMFDPDAPLPDIGCAMKTRIAITTVSRALLSAYQSTVRFTSGALSLFNFARGAIFHYGSLAAMKLCEHIKVILGVLSGLGIALGAYFYLNREKSPEVAVLEPESHSNYSGSAPLNKRQPVRVVPAKAHYNVDITQKIRSNLFSIDIAGATTRGLFVKERIALVPTHLIGDAAPGSVLVLTDMANRVYRFTFEDCKREDVFMMDYTILSFPVKDAIGTTLPEFSNIIHFFPTTASHQSVSGRISAYLMFEHELISTNLDSSHTSIRYDCSGATVLCLAASRLLVPTKPGDCGLPVLAAVESSLPPIRGLIVAGTENITWVSAITADHINSTLCLMRGANQPIAHSNRVPPASEPWAFKNPMETFSIEREGKIQSAPPLPRNSSFRKNDRAKEALQDCVHPAALSGRKYTVPGSDKKFTPFERALHLRSSPQNIAKWNVAVLRAESTAMLTKLLGPPGETKLQMLSAETAAIGAESFAAMKRNASPGFPLSQKNSKNSYWLDYEHQPAAFSELMAHVAECKKNPHFYPFTASLKDELVSPEKYELGKTRIFMSGSLPFNIRVRMIFGDFLTRLRSANLNETSVAVGTPFSVASRDYAFKRIVLENLDAKFDLADVPGFDNFQDKIVFNIFADVLSRWMEPIHAQEMFDLLPYLYCPYIMVDNVVYRLENIMPSGIAVTAEFNSTVRDLVAKHHAHVAGVRQHIRGICTYGDDALIAYAPEADISLPKMARIYEAYGWGLTHPNKKDPLPEFFTADQVEFCKRVIVNRQCVRPLHLLKQAGGWTRKKMGIDTAIQAIHDCLREAIAYHDNYKTFIEVFAFYISNTNYSNDELLFDMPPGALLALASADYAVDAGSAFSGRKRREESQAKASSSNSPSHPPPFRRKSKKSKRDREPADYVPSHGTELTDSPFSFPDFNEDFPAPASEESESFKRDLEIAIAQSIVSACDTALFTSRGIQNLTSDSYDPEMETVYAVTSAPDDPHYRFFEEDSEYASMADSDSSDPFLVDDVDEPPDDVSVSVLPLALDVAQIYPEEVDLSKQRQLAEEERWSHAFWSSYMTTHMICIIDFWTFKRLFSAYIRAVAPPHFFLLQPPMSDWTDAELRETQLEPINAIAYYLLKRDERKKYFPSASGFFPPIQLLNEEYAFLYGFFSRLDLQSMDVLCCSGNECVNYYPSPYPVHVDTQLDPMRALTPIPIFWNALHTGVSPPLAGYWDAEWARIVGVGDDFIPAFSWPNSFPPINYIALLHPALAVLYGTTFGITSIPFALMAFFTWFTNKNGFELLRRNFFLSLPGLTTFFAGAAGTTPTSYIALKLKSYLYPQHLHVYLYRVKIASKAAVRY
jgi:hypothetical protein